MFDQIRKEIHEAATHNQKIAMFHFQVLCHAKQLENLDAELFCKEMAVPTTYQTEFRKMLGLARLMRDRGVSIVG